METNLATALDKSSNEHNTSKNGTPKASPKTETPKYHRGHKKGASSLHEAALSGDLEGIKSLLKRGKAGSLNASGPDQTTPLHEAAYADQGTNLQTKSNLSCCKLFFKSRSNKNLHIF